MKKLEFLQMFEEAILSIHLIDGPILLKCDFNRNLTESTKLGVPVNISIQHESKGIISEDLKTAEVIYHVQCSTPESLFLFSIDYGCKFKIDGFKSAKEAHVKVMQIAVVLLQGTVRDFVADLTRRSGQQPLLFPMLEFEKGLEDSIVETKVEKGRARKVK